MNPEVFGSRDNFTELASDYRYTKDEVVYCAGCGEAAYVRKESDRYDDWYYYYCTCAHSRRWEELKKEQKTLTPFLDDFKKYVKEEKSRINKELAQVERKLSAISSLEKLNGL